MEAKVVDTSSLGSPELDGIVDELVDGIVVASSRAMANLADPGGFPLTADPDSVERILVDSARLSDSHDRMAVLKRKGRGVIADPVAALGPKRAGLLRSIDLKSTDSVLDQLAGPAPRGPGGRKLRDLPSPTQGPHSTLVWHLNHVKCVEETGRTNIGSDHLYIGGVTIDPFGNTAFAGVHDLTGGWDSKNDQDFNTDLAVSDLSVGFGWPRTHYYVSAISIRGSDKLYELLDKIVKVARDKLVELAASAAGAYVGAWVGLKYGAALGAWAGPLGFIAGAAVGAAIGYLVGEAMSRLWDELSEFFKGETKLFEVKTLQMDLPRQGVQSDPGSTWTQPWEGHRGEYRLSFDFRLHWVPDFKPAAISLATDKLGVARVNGSGWLQLRSWPEAGQWSEWDTLVAGGISPDTPVTIVDLGNGMKSVFATNLKGLVLGTTLGGVPSGAIPGSAVGAVSRGASMVDVFLTASDGKPYTAARGPRTGDVWPDWAGWWPVLDGALLPGTPISAVSRAEGRLDIFAVGVDGRVWSAAYGPEPSGEWEWTGWFPILHEVFVPGSHVAAISRKPNQLDLFAVNLDGQVRTASWSPDANDGKWGGWWRITGTNGSFVPGTPVSVTSRGPKNLAVFAIGLDRRVWTAAWGPETDGVWDGWWPIEHATFAMGSPIAATSRSLGHIDLFVGGLDGNIWSQAWHDGVWSEFTI